MTRGGHATDQVPIARQPQRLTDGAGRAMPCQFSSRRVPRPRLACGALQVAVALAVAATCVALSCCSIAAAQGDGSSSTGGGDAGEALTLHLGAVLSSSGAYVEMANARRGYELAVEAVNALNGGKGAAVGDAWLKLELDVREDESDAELHYAGIDALLMDGVRVMLGSHPAFAVNETATVSAADGISFQCCVGPDPIYEAGQAHVYGIQASNTMYPRFLLKGMGLRGAARVAVAGRADNLFTSTTCEAAVAQAEEFDMEVVYVGHYTAETATDPEEIRRHVDAAVAARADVYVGCAFLDDSILTVEQFAEAAHGVRPKGLFLTVGPTLPAFREQLPAELTAGVLTAGQWHPAVRYPSDALFGSTLGYVDAYTEAYGEEPAYVAAGASAVVETTMLALQAAFDGMHVVAAPGDSEGEDDDAVSAADVLLETATGRGAFDAALMRLDIDTFFGGVAMNKWGRNSRLAPTGMQVSPTGDDLHVVTPTEFGNAQLVYPLPNSAQCVAGESPTPDASACRRCKAGTVNLISATESGCTTQTCCSTCPVGAVCFGGDMLVPAEGFWRSSPSSLYLYPCRPADACVYAGREAAVLAALEAGNSTTTSQMLCAPGHQGILCATCAATHFRSLGRCALCPASSAGRRTVFALLTSLLVLAGAITFKYRMLLPRDLVKVLVPFLQVLAAIGTQYEVRWPAAFAGLLAGMELFLLDAVSATRADCVAALDYFSRFVSVVVLAVAVGAVVVLAVLLQRVVLVIKRKQFGDSKWNAPRAVWDRGDTVHVFRAGMAFAVFCHPGLSLAVLRVFGCIEVDGQYRLQQDVTITCYDEQWWAYATLAAVLALVYVAGLPAYLLYALWQHRGTLADPRTMLRLGWTYTPYGERCWYMLPAEMLRKVTLVALPVFWSPGSATPLAVAVLVCVFFHQLHSIKRPFPSYKAYMLQHWSLGLSTVLFIVGLLFNASALSIVMSTNPHAAVGDNDDDGGRGTTAGWFDVLAGILMVVVVVYLCVGILLFIVKLRANVRRFRVLQTVSGDNADEADLALRAESSHAGGDNGDDDGDDGGSGGALRRSADVDEALASLGEKTEVTLAEYVGHHFTRLRLGLERDPRQAEALQGVDAGATRPSSYPPGGARTSKQRMSIVGVFGRASDPSRRATRPSSAIARAATSTEATLRVANGIAGARRPLAVRASRVVHTPAAGRHTPSASAYYRHSPATTPETAGDGDETVRVNPLFAAPQPRDGVGSGSGIGSDSTRLGSIVEDHGEAVGRDEAPPKLAGAASSREVTMAPDRDESPVGSHYQSRAGDLRRDSDAADMGTATDPSTVGDVGDVGTVVAGTF